MRLQIMELPHRHDATGDVPFAVVVDRVSDHEAEVLAEIDTTDAARKLGARTILVIAGGFSAQVGPDDLL